MAIGPRGPRLKNDGPACRVCGCTEHNACVIRSDDTFTATRMLRLLTCSWVKVEGATPPLCSACSGTVEDAQEAMQRATRMLVQHGSLDFPMVIMKAARARYLKRLKGA